MSAVLLTINSCHHTTDNDIPKAPTEINEYNLKTLEKYQNQQDVILKQLTADKVWQLKYINAKRVSIYLPCNHEQDIIKAVNKLSHTKQLRLVFNRCDDTIQLNTTDYQNLSAFKWKTLIIEFDADTENNKFSSNPTLAQIKILEKSSDIQHIEMYGLKEVPENITNYIRTSEKTWWPEAIYNP